MITKDDLVISEINMETGLQMTAILEGREYSYLFKPSDKEGKESFIEWALEAFNRYSRRIG